MSKKSSLDRLSDQGVKVQQGTRRNNEEWQLVKNIDEKQALQRYRKSMEKLNKGTIDMPQFLHEISNSMIAKLLFVAETTRNEKTLVSVAQDLLDRAGHGKISKAVVATGSLDRNTTKKELVNMVLSLSKQAGLKVKEPEDEGDIVDAESVELPDSQ